MTHDETLLKARRYRRIGVAATVAAVLIALGTLYALHQVAVHDEKPATEAKAADAVKVGLLPAPGSALLASAVRERGDLWVQHLDAAGRVKWAAPAHNALTSWGQQRVLKCVFTGTGCPAVGAFYFALLTSTPSYFYTTFGNELAGGGYARQNVASWTCTSLSGGTANSCSSTSPLTWTNATGSSWTTVSALAVVDTASGAPSATGYISYIALSAPRTVVAGDTLQVVYYTLTLQ